MRELQDRPQEHWALLKNDKGVNTKLAIFIHGFYGNYLSTWGKIPDLLKKHADGEEPFLEWDYLFLGYKTGTISTYLDIARLLGSQCKTACLGKAPFNKQYSEIAFFGHSLGTLGIRQLLCAWTLQHPEDLISKIKSVTLFGTPLNGSRLADLAFWSKIANALEPKNPQLRMLKTWNECAHSKMPWPPVKILLGLDDKVVGSEHAELVEWLGDEEADLSNLDHGTLVKPELWKGSLAIDYIKNALR